MPAQSKKERGKGRKSWKFGARQKTGTSRAAYFAIAPFRIAANKERRIAKEARLQQKRKERKEANDA